MKVLIRTCFEWYRINADDVGAPTIYYGDEAGLCGWTDPDSRRAYPWGHEDEELIQYHKELIRIHKEHQVLRTGSILFLFGEYQCISYGRFDDNEHIVVAINISQDTRHMEIPVWRLGMTQPTRMARVILTDASGFSIETKVYPVQSGKIDLRLPTRDGSVSQRYWKPVVIRCNNGKEHEIS